MDRSQGTFTTFTTKDGLPGNTISAILEDARGYLWVATHDGLSRFDPRNRSFRNYSESDGLPDNFLNPYFAESSAETRTGEIVFGSSKGLTTFYPDRLSDNSYVPPVVITDFQLFNKSVDPGAGSPLHNPIWATDSLTLTHRQNILTLEFSALSYMAPENNRYRFRLEPLETQWNTVDSGRRRSTYTSLPAGKYTFRVQGSNNDGLWNETGTRLDITVLPPWWGTWWFRMIACVSVIGMAFVAYWSRIRSLHLAASRLELQVERRTHELQIAKDSADAANRAKSTFLANMSHEFRTPLNAILGFSKLLRDGNLSEKDRRDLDIVHRSGEHLLNLINDVLDVAKIESGRTVLEIAPCNPRIIVGEVTDMMRVRANEKNLALHLVESPLFPRSVKTDATKLRQVLINLLGNAVKFTRKGAITLRLNARPADTGERLLLTFEVQDTGIGIAAEDQLRIFDAFVQLGSHRTQKGTGLGLTITRQFVDLMGGTIRVESTPGKGSRFEVDVPVERAEGFDVTPSESQEERIVGLEPGQGDFRILIVDDEVENRLLLERLLQNAGFQVRVAEDGARGVEMFRSWRPHFIWMDLRMPVMDGKDATRRIRTLEGGREVKIAAVTASAFASERDQVLAAGVDDFMRKPYRPREIFDCMARHLGLRYIYRNSRPEQRDVILRKEELHALPQELLRELEVAVTTLDDECIRQVIARISDLDATLGGKLAHYSDRLAYTAILNAVEACNDLASPSAI
jgi:signal transduction histidine kinase/FixJ family two-component response regulator